MTEVSAGRTSDVVEEGEDEGEEFWVEMLRTIVVEPSRLVNFGFRVAIVDARDVDGDVEELVDVLDCSSHAPLSEPSRFRYLSGH